MTLLTPLALIGLLLLPALIALHLRRRQAQLVEVPSLILWEDLGGAPGDGGKHWRLEALLLLLLQLLAASALVLALAQPAGTAEPATSRVYVIDAGAQMGVADPAPSRLAAAQAIVVRDIQAAPAGTRFAIVVAVARPSVLVSTTDGALAVSRLRRLIPAESTADLRGALVLAAGLLPAHHAHLLVIAARGEMVPPIRAPRGLVAVESIGRVVDNQSIAALSVRCAPGTCTAYADLRNDGGAAVRDTLSVGADGAVLGQRSLVLPAHADVGVGFAVPSARHLLQLSVTGRDPIPTNRLSWAVIPGPPTGSVTVVGEPGQTAPLVRALAASGGVRVMAIAPSGMRRLGQGVPGLLVLAGWLPPGPLPAVPSLLLVDPPRLPGASEPPPLAGTGVSDVDTASPLLDGVDLTSLDSPAGSARRYLLPAGIRPIVSAADGPLLAAGTLEGRRVVILAPDPMLSNLSQLPAFPILLRNIVAWSGAWLPSAAAPGARLAFDIPPATAAIEAVHRASLASPPIAVRVTRGESVASLDVSSPGIYTVTERGAWGERSAAVVANAGLRERVDVATPLSLPAPGAPLMDGTPAQGATWWPWLGLLAALAIAAEWLLAGPLKGGQR